jgi:hypothetical protein
MCPICIATAAWLSAGAGSALGLALLVNKQRSKLHSKRDPDSTAGNGRSVFASAKGVAAQARTPRDHCGDRPPHRVG